MQNDPPKAQGRPRDATAGKRIQAAASSLFLERGYNNTTIQHIAAKAGIGRQTIYRRWPSKFELALDILNETAAFEIDDTAPIDEFIRQMVRAVAPNTNLMQSVMAEAQGSDDARCSMVQRFIEPRRRVLQETLQREWPTASKAHIKAMISGIYGSLWYAVLTDAIIDETLSMKILALIELRRLGKNVQ